jgi:hypothetical protein
MVYGQAEDASRFTRLPFDPWHALIEHRPLGNMMRARKHAYFASTKGRSAGASCGGFSSSRDVQCPCPG